MNKCRRNVCGVFLLLLFADASCMCDAAMRWQPN